jgi:serine protease Do
VTVKAPQAPSFADVVEAVSPAVVSVRVHNTGVDLGGPGDGAMERFLREFKKQGSKGEGSAPSDEAPSVRPVSQGSGFFISGDGYVVTNEHVIDGGDSFSVILDDGTQLGARLVGADNRTDIAVLKVEKPKRSFTYVGFADDDSVRIGDWVVSVGNPYGLGGTVTAGIVSARGRDLGAGPYDDFIQFDAVVNRGDAGGPAFNLNGKVVGVDTTVFSPSGGNVGVTFAVPASTVEAVVSDLIRHGAVKRGWLGVQIQPVTRDIAASVGLAKAEGALVADFVPGAPAKAVLEAGDVITSLNGRPVREPRDLARRISAIDPGKEAKIGLWRNGEPMTVEVRVGTMPGTGASAETAEPRTAVKAGDDRPLRRFGLTVVPAEDGRGVLVTEVDVDSAADQRGLTAGDVILSVNSRAVKSADDILSAIAAAGREGRKAALFRVENSNHNRFVALPIDMG